MNEPTQQTAVQKRAAHPDFVPTFSLEALQERLPFPFPVPDDVPLRAQAPLPLSVPLPGRRRPGRSGRPEDPDLL